MSRPPWSQSINLRLQGNLPRNRDVLHFLAEWRAMISPFFILTILVHEAKFDFRVNIFEYTYMQLPV